MAREAPRIADDVLDIGALDAGAHGIVVPLLYTPDDARKLVQSAKFPPVGQRGFGSPFPMEKFGGQTTAEYLQQANEALVTVVQIETKEALENVWHNSGMHELSPGRYGS